jgi:uncharacterized damage-inducible protein DinB
MNKCIAICFLFTALCFAQPAAPGANNPLSTWLRDAYTRNRSNIVRVAEKMPEENYAMRPGTQQEVRTFGQQVTHVAAFNFLWCSQAKGEKNPRPGDLSKLTSKAEILKALNDAFTYCDGAYGALTDASGTEMVDIMQESGRQTRSLRMGLLTLNYGHNNEIYGSMVVYLRIKNIVPPASEPHPQPKK